MAYNVSNKYKQIIYSGDARNKLKLLFNNVELPNADLYCEKLVVRSRIVPNGSKVFSLNNFVSKEADLILHDIDTSVLQDQVSISIGTLVDNDYEYVPIGIFNIQDQPTNDKNKTTIKLRDNSVKFDFNYNAQPLIDENGGSATKLQILQDICTQANVTCNITSFLGYLDEIGVYDNTITARQYIANIAEQAGKIATINRDGELIFVDLNNLTTWEIPIEIVEKYENGTKFKIGKVVYEDGIVRYETPDSNDDTLFLDGSNNYINNDLNLAEASSTNNNYVLENTGDSELAYLKLEGKTTQETRSGRNLYNYKDTNAYVTSGITVDDEGWISITYDNTSGSSIAYFNYWTNNLNLQTNTNYNIITEIKSVSGSGALFPMSSFTSSGQFLDYIAYGFDGISNNDVIAQIKTTKDNFTYIGDGLRTFIQFDVGQSGSITFRISVLEDTTITPTSFVYEPYGAMPSPSYPSEMISVGYQNLLKDSSSEWSQWYTPTYNVENISTYLYFTTENLQKFKNGQKFTLSFDVEFENVSGTSGQAGGGRWIPQIVINQTLDTMHNGQWFEFFSESPLYSNPTDGVHHMSHTFTLNNDFTNYVRYGFVPRLDYWASGRWRIRNVQLQVGDTANGYIPYGKYGIEIKTSDNNNNNNTYLYTLDNPLRSIGDTKDLLYIKNGMLYVDRKIGSVVLDGSETWYKSSDDGGYPRYYTIISNAYFHDDSSRHSDKIKSNYFIATITASPQSIYQYRDQMLFDTPTTLNTLQLFKTWLSTNNVEVEYLLQNPYIEELGKVQIPSTYTASTSIQINTFLDTNTYIRYREKETKLESILNETNMFNIDSLKTGKILGNPAIDSYDLIKIHDKSKNLFDADTIIMGDYINLNPTIRASSRQSLYLERGQYTLTTNLDLSTYGLAIAILPNTPPSTSYNAIQDFGYISNQKTTFNVTNNGYVVFTFRKNGNLTFVLDDIKQFFYQLEKGNLASDYVPFKDATYITLATNDLTYTGVLTNTFDTQIGEEAKEQNVFVNGEETFKKWARTKIDNVEGAISLQAGRIDETNGRIDQTTLDITSQGALLNVIANNSNIDVSYDENGNPISGEVREVTTTTGFKFNAEGMTIEDSSSNFKALHRNTGTYYLDGTTIVGQYTKDGSKQKDLDLFGIYTYGKNDINETPMFIAQLFTDGNGEEGFGHFYNRGD